MAKTRIDLANRALEKLMRTGAGQPPEAEDTQTADNAIDGMVETLSALNVYTVADIDDIDLPAFEWLADYLAYLVAPDFGVPQNDDLRVRSEYMLRRIAMQRPTFQTLKAEYF